MGQSVLERLIEGHNNSNKPLCFKEDLRQEHKITGSLKIKYISDNQERDGEIIGQQGSLVEVVDLETGEVVIIHEDYVKKQETKKEAAKRKHAEIYPDRERRPNCQNFKKCENTTDHKSGICAECRTIKCKHQGCGTVVASTRYSNYCSQHYPNKPTR